MMKSTKGYLTKGKRKMKNNCNADIRAMIAAKGLCFYEVAAALNVKPNTVSQYLRKDLSDYQKNRIKTAIAKAEKAKELNNGQKEKDL